DLLQPANPALDPTALRQHQRRQSRRHWASAAVLLIAVSVGGLGGWQARQIIQPGNLPMSDALAAHRMFAEQGFLPADYNVVQSSEMQGWVDRYFSHAERLPDLTGAGFRPVSSRLLTTDQGGAAMVLYQDRQGRQISFYIRPPGPHNSLLPRGNRQDGELQAQYWSGPGYNYAMVGPAGLLETVKL
ncbi:MAG: anti-sigma factor, partial [Pseudomonas sp.]|nr:anti-sigma factor [Pseudomonas sp.]